MASVAFPSLSKSLTVKDGTRFGYINVAAKPGKPTLLFLHGYPSSSYDWRHQVTQFPEHGYGIIIPDLLGYGDTDKPDNIESYDLTRMARNLIEILDNEGVDKVVGIGHDWGCGILSTLAHRFQQKRLSALVFMAVGYIANGAAFADVDAINKATIEAIGRPIFGYWKFHNDPKAAGIMEKLNPRSISSLVYPLDPKTWIDNVCKEGKMQEWIEQGITTDRPAWLSQEEDETHSKIMLAGGYTGPLNWYKQAIAGVTTATEGDLTDEDRKLKVPTLFIGCEKDYICIPAFQEAEMRPWVEDLTVANVDSGHWVMLEKKDEMFSILVDFIQKKVSK